jgi:hypothetical protein
MPCQDLPVGRITDAGAHKCARPQSCTPQQVRRTATQQRLTNGSRFSGWSARMSIVVRCDLRTSDIRCAYTSSRAQPDRTRDAVDAAFPSGRSDDESWLHPAGQVEGEA